MKSTFFSILALPALFLGAIAAPAPADNTVTVREESKVAQAAAIVQALGTEIKKYTADINSTTASITTSSTAAEKAAAAKEVTADFISIDQAIYTANAEILALSAPKISPRQSQSDVDLAALEAGLTMVFLELGNTVSSVQNVLSGGSLDLTQLPTALYGLVQGLGTVVAGILGMLETNLDNLGTMLTSLIPGFPTSS